MLQGAFASSSMLLYQVSPNVVLELLILLFLIREVPCSNLSPETSYRNSVLCDFPEALQTNTEIVLHIRPRPLPSTAFPNLHSRVTDAM
jgi:hypothetical protein